MVLFIFINLHALTEDVGESCGDRLGVGSEFGRVDGSKAREQDISQRCLPLQRSSLSRFRDLTLKRHNIYRTENVLTPFQCKVSKQVLLFTADI